VAVAAAAAVAAVEVESAMTPIQSIPGRKTQPQAAARRVSQLLEALDSFRIDDAEQPEWSFVRRLAREHRWTQRYADRVIIEYKRFLALTVLANHVVCPSEQIDQAWHLHLVYTHSYWKRLCKDVLHKELHHSPSHGGTLEHHKHVDLYQRTLDSYRVVFGEYPPADIWPAVARRFGSDVQAARVNTTEHLIISKRGLVQIAIVLAVSLLCAVVGALSTG
jgi:hypothetical protein